MTLASQGLAAARLSSGAQKKAAAEAAAVHREETPRKGSGVKDAAHRGYTLRCGMDQALNPVLTRKTPPRGV